MPDRILDEPWLWTELDYADQRIFAICPVCGAAVLEPHAHADWHRQHETAERWVAGPLDGLDPEIVRALEEALRAEG